LATVDYLLENSQSLKSWRSDDREQVLDILEEGIKQWSKRKEQMFTRNHLEQAVEHLYKNAPDE
ncbi:MAG: hypothetical protein LUC91_10945, partial [Prevotella sp.]|nr:hypothetical protein [Prevotella sp.]